VTTIAPPPPAPPVNPPPTSPPPLSPGGRTAIRLLLIAAAAVLVLGGVGTLGVAAWGLSTFRVVTDSKPLPPTMRSLVVDTGQLPVAVRITAEPDATQPRADIRMINSARAGSHPLTVTTDSTGTRLTISGEPSPFLQWGRAGEITVVLPPEVARGLTVTSQQRTGVLMTQTDLDQVTARMTHGAVLLSGSARRVEVDSVDGDVVARTAISVTESFRASTANGDIEVDFKTAPRTLDANTDNGDIRIALPASGPYVVNVDTSDRSSDTVVRVPQTTDRKDAASVVTARSDTGDIEIDQLR
jgi:Putative adhesin